MLLFFMRFFSTWTSLLCYKSNNIVYDLLRTILFIYYIYNVSIFIKKIYYANIL